MNLDLLKKLTRLANNNPNDNEANLAARKVCKMLEASNWSLPILPPVKQAEKVRTWADVKRSEEPFFKSRPQSSNNDHFKNFWDQYVKNMTPEERARWNKETKGTWDIPFKDGKYKSPFETAQRKEREKKEKRMLECTRCHQMKETAYVGNLYVCIDCYWVEYESKKGK